MDNRKKVKTWAGKFGGSLFRTFASEVLESQNTDSCGRCPLRKSKLGFILKNKSWTGNFLRALKF